ncbi:MAG: plasmid pRiA4b ORF-3 family protein [Chitinophagales bacterium]|nr:plasmid pRiA4b ORF-3 family protein [Chitinophagales bacterium]
MKDIIRLNISLNDSAPLIWRELAVNSDISFAELHHTIQIAMGWKNYHLFEFNTEGYRIGLVFNDGIEDGLDINNLLDADTTLLRDIISSVGETIQYEYDFGANWEHTIEVLDFDDAIATDSYPVCLDGEMASPPDDCLNIHHYYYLLDVLNNKAHPDHGDIGSWISRDFDANAFDIEEINKDLSAIDRYIIQWRKRNL